MHWRKLPHYWHTCRTRAADNSHRWQASCLSHPNLNPGGRYMSKMIFVNLPVTDLAASTSFYTALGCVRNPQFSDENVSSMQWSDMITFQLLARPYFASFSPKPVADPQQTCQA